MPEQLVCTPKFLPDAIQESAATRAIEINPANQPHVAPVLAAMGGSRFRPFISAVTTKYWHGHDGAHFTVRFLDNPPKELRNRILSHLNAWSKTANVEFVETGEDAEVRISREGGNDGGYWSYLGTDVLHIPGNEPTMNLEGFSMEHPESEFVRVIRHEAGHTMGFPHEHMRRDLVERIDDQKAIEFFLRTQGWSEAETRAQVLTPIEEATLLGTNADPDSIMCYQIPGSITKDGKPILGGSDIDEVDYEFAGRLYPR